MPSINKKAQSIIDEFAELEDWESKYTYIIDLGKSLAPISEKDKNAANLVHGCQSQVWLVSSEIKKDNQICLVFTGDSDALIVKGLLTMTLFLYSDHSPKEILDFDFDAFLNALGLEGSLSMTRSKGLKALVKKIRLAAEHN